MTQFWLQWSLMRLHSLHYINREIYKYLKPVLFNISMRCYALNHKVTKKLNKAHLTRRYIYQTHLRCILTFEELFLASYIESLKLDSIEIS